MIQRNNPGFPGLQSEEKTLSKNFGYDAIYRRSLKCKVTLITEGIFFFVNTEIVIRLLSVDESRDLAYGLKGCTLLARDSSAKGDAEDGR